MHPLSRNEFIYDTSLLCALQRFVLYTKIWIEPDRIGVDRGINSLEIPNKKWLLDFDASTEVGSLVPFKHIWRVRPWLFSMINLPLLLLTKTISTPIFSLSVSYKRRWGSFYSRSYSISACTSICTLNPCLSHPRLRSTWNLNSIITQKPRSTVLSTIQIHPQRSLALTSFARQLVSCIPGNTKLE